MNQPLVSISIPTRNSEAFIGRCLDSVFAQTYPNLEVIIVDGCSRDNTRSIAGRYDLKLLDDSRGLLSARKLGSEAAAGEYVLLLDSDQILEPSAVERAIRVMDDNDLDMLVLEEDVYHNSTFLEHLFHADRKLIHAIKDFSPETGVMLPRLYKKDLISRVFQSIPEDVLQTGGQDHAIIYYEALQLSQRVDLLPEAVKHIEPSTLRELIPKFYRWGYTSAGARNSKYSRMLARKERFRKGTFSRGLVVASLGSIALMIIKGVPYKLGLLVARAKKK